MQRADLASRFDADGCESCFKHLEQIDFNLQERGLWTAPKLAGLTTTSWRFTSVPSERTTRSRPWIPPSCWAGQCGMTNSIWRMKQSTANSSPHFWRPWSTASYRYLKHGLGADDHLKNSRISPICQQIPATLYTLIWTCPKKNDDKPWYTMINHHTPALWNIKLGRKP